MLRISASRIGVSLLLFVTVVSTSGCTIIVNRAASNFGANLTGAILNQDDPELVRAGMPSYILLLDSFLQGEDDSPVVLSAAAGMYAAYGAVFADDEARSARLTSRARAYGLQAMCGAYVEACGWQRMTHDDFVASLAGVEEKHAELLYTFGFASLAYLQAHTSDWNALAELPQAEAVLKRYIELSGDAANPSAYSYLGILLTLRPPALGGKPEEAREYFERAIALSGGRDLGVKVAYAEGYAKLLYEKELHDRLVDEVLTSSPHADGYTLMNVLAQEDALRLKAESAEYF